MYKFLKRCCQLFLLAVAGVILFFNAGFYYSPDSGPVIWGIGGAASVVGQRAAYANGDLKLYKGLRNSIEAFGFGFTCFGEKRYVFGQLPIADAFIAWSNSVEKTPVDAPVTIPWLIHLISVIFLVVIGWVGYKL